MAFEFKKLKPNRIYQNVVDQIQEAILSGQVEPGEMLPSEMKLKEMFQTSRGTIREALRVLEQKGLIEVKIGVGGGATVKPLDTTVMSESLDLLLQYKKVSIDHLAEFRESVEGIVAALAAERATPEGIERLQELLAKGQEILSKRTPDWKQFLKIDVELHIVIAEISLNPVFIAVLHMIHEKLLVNFDQFSFRKKEVLEENYQSLCDLVEAIKNREADKARILSQQHVTQFNNYMKK